MGNASESFRYLTYVRNCLRRRGRTREDAEDLVQEAFLRLELYCREGHQVLQPEAFLMRTALNLSVSHHRREQRSPIGGRVPFVQKVPVSLLQHINGSVKRLRQQDVQHIDQPGIERCRES
jgi:DNA-directed RNA polymerase specialized sigma24 family protein